MRFPENASGKRQHFQRISKSIKYAILKKDNGRGKEQMKHKPYTCDMKYEKQKGE